MKTKLLALKAVIENTENKVGLETVTELIADIPEGNTVTVQITPEGWKTEVNVNEHTSIETHFNTSYGSKSKGVLFEDDPKISDELFDVLCDIGAHDIMKVLRRINLGI